MNVAEQRDTKVRRKFVDLIGTRLDGYELVEKVGEGAFSVVYKGQNSDGEYKAFKVARSKPDYKPALTGCFGTEAMVVMSGAIGTGHPSGQALLSRQFDLMNKLGAALVPAENFQQEVLSYIRMPLLHGSSLRDLMKNEAISLDCLVKIAEALCATFKNEGEYHGDLKPENIIICNGNCQLIDPGYFGEIESANGPLVEMKITTGEYYPLLVPNDIMAFGLIMLEIVLQKNLLAQKSSLSQMPSSCAGKSLLEKISRQERGYNYFFSSILRLGNKSQESLKLKNSPLCGIILKCLALQIDINGVVDLGEAYTSHAQVLRDLSSIDSTGFGVSSNAV